MIRTVKGTSIHSSVLKVKIFMSVTISIIPLTRPLRSILAVFLLLSSRHCTMIAGGNTRHLKLHDSFRVLKSNTYLFTFAFVHTPQCFQSKKRRRDTSFSTKSFNNAENQNSLSAINNIAIVGGGLAGLSTAYHLLEVSQLSNMPLRITIYDKSMVGEGGASAVAGG